MQADADADDDAVRPAAVAHPPLGGKRGVDGRPGVREGRQQLVADRIDFVTLVLDDCGAQDPTHGSDDRRVVDSLVLLEQGRALDVSEEERHRACREEACSCVRVYEATSRARDAWRRPA